MIQSLGAVYRCRANMAQIGQSRPNSCLDSGKIPIHNSSLVARERPAIRVLAACWMELERLSHRLEHTTNETVPEVSDWYQNRQLFQNTLVFTANSCKRRSTLADQCVEFAQSQIHLTEYFHWSVLESQLPHKLVNWMFTITNQNIESTVWWGVWLSKNN
jgi:hypothetical protein